MDKIYGDFRDLRNAKDGNIEIDVTEDISRVALCTLSAVNLGKVDPQNLSTLEGTMKNIVCGLDNLLTYQDYVLPAAKEAMLDFRPIGVGIINLAYFFAKHGVRYGEPEALQLIFKVMEAIQFYGIKASIELAKLKGPCRMNAQTKYSQGILPIDHYNQNIHDFFTPQFTQDWDSLRPDLVEFGIRNATITALMPAETSAKICNGTNGVEPVRSLVTVKGNKSNISKQVVPEIEALGDKYDMLWDMTGMGGIIKTMAVIQIFVDQSISTNLSYNPEHFKNEEIPMSVLTTDILKANRYGLKTLYYHNTNDNRDGGNEDTGENESNTMESSHPPVEEDDCDSCKL